MYNKITKISAIKIPTNELYSQLHKMRLYPSWSIQNEEKQQYLLREQVFPDFETTWSFLNQVAMRSHLYGHHPTITIIYNRVIMKLSTYDIENGVISNIDLKLAKRIESYINVYTSPKK